MIHKQKMLSAAINALCMSCIMSLFMCWFNVGCITGFVFVWLKTWFVAFLIAMPLAYVLPPHVNQFVGFICRKKQNSP